MFGSSIGSRGTGLRWGPWARAAPLGQGAGSKGPCGLAALFFAGLVFWVICYAMSRYSQNLEKKLSTER